jgi:hypothetical protein
MAGPNPCFSQASRVAGGGGEVGLGCGGRVCRLLLLSLVLLVGEYRLDAQGAHDAGPDADAAGKGKVLQTKWFVHVPYLLSS